MQRKTASDFDPEVMKLFDQYVHGAIDRRAFLNRATNYAVGGMMAAMLLDALNPKFAEAQQVQKDDARITRQVPRVRIARRLRQDARLSGDAVEGSRQTARRVGGARESRAQPAH